MFGTQIAPTYLSSCLNQGLGLLEILLLKQPIQDNRLVLKVRLLNLILVVFLYFCLSPWCFCIFVLSPETRFCEQTLELCRLYELENVGTNIMKVKCGWEYTHNFLFKLQTQFFHDHLGF